MKKDNTHNHLTRGAGMPRTAISFAERVATKTVRKVRSVLVLLILFMVLGGVSTANAVAKVSTGTGLWNSADTWDPSGVPGVDDAVTILGYHTVTVDTSSAMCASLQVHNGRNGLATLLFNANSSLAVAGNVLLTGKNVSHKGIINMAAGGLLTVGGALTASGSGAVWTPGLGTVELTAGNALPATVFTSFFNLTLNHGGTTTLGVNTAINTGGTLTQTSGNIAVGDKTLTVIGIHDAKTAVVSGTGGYTLATGAILKTEHTSGINGNITVSGTKSLSTGANYTYNGSVAQVTGALLPATVNNLTINNTAGVTDNANRTVNGVLNLQSTNPSATKGTLDMSGGTTLTMGASATTTGTGDLTGIVKRTTLVATTTYTFGNQYTTVDFQNTGTLPTSVSVKIAIGSAPSWKTDAVKRIYDFIETGGSDCFATVNAHYLDSELNGNTENSLVWWVSGTPFTPGTEVEYGKSNYSLENNWVGISSVPIHIWPASFGQQAETLGDSLLSSVTWDGSVNADWVDADNWTPAGVPSGLVDVVIPDASSTDYDPTLPAGAATIGRITIQSGGILNATEGSSLTLSGASGAWSDNGGTFNHSTSTVIFNNAAATISGNTDFYNVTINSGAGVTPGSGDRMVICGEIINNGTWHAALNANNTVEYEGAAQTVLSPNGLNPGYYNLILSGSGIKALPSTTTARGNVEINSGVVFNLSNGGSSDVGSLTLGGVLQAAGTWGSSSSSATHKDDTYFSGTGVLNVTHGPLDHFAISTIGSPQTVGTPITGITLTAQDANNNLVTSFGSAVTYGGTAGITGISPAFTAGQLTGVSVTPTVVGSGKTFTVTASGKIGTATFDVNPVVGTFQSHQTGNWNIAATWERWSGSAWVTPAPSTPTSADAEITIRDGHTVTVTANVTVDQVVVQSGGQITVDSGVTLTLETDGTDLQTDSGGKLVVNGSVAPADGTIATFVGSGAVLAGNGTISGDVVVEDGGTVAPGNSVGTITVEGDETFEAGSTNEVEIGTFPDSDKIIVGGVLTLETTGDGVTLDIVGDLDGVGRTIMISSNSIVGTFSGLPENTAVQPGYFIHYNVLDTGGAYADMYHVTIDTSDSGPTSSGIDLRAYQAADGIYVEFAAYDVEEDGTIRLTLLGADGQPIWTGTVNVVAGPKFIARFLVPGLVLGESYSFILTDEVGKAWTATGVIVGSFDTEMTEMTLTGVTLTFGSLPEREYDIQWTAQLGGIWQTVDTVTAAAAKTSVTVAYPDPQDPSGFFRIQLK